MTRKERRAIKRIAEFLRGIVAEGWEDGDGRPLAEDAEIAAGMLEMLAEREAMRPARIGGE